MDRREWMRQAALVAVAGLAPYPGQAQARPTKIVVPYPAGGPLDAMTRVLADKVKDSLGAVIVENRAGAGGNLGADHVAKSPPDGHTLVVGAVATHAINPWLYARIPYDPIRDFAPITLVARVPNVLVMNVETVERLRIRTVQELIAYARKNPGRLNYGSGGNGSAGHLAGEMFKTQAKVSMVHIPYAGGAPAQLGLLAGQVDLNFDNLATAAANIRAGKLKALAVTTLERASAMPELPTIAESGLPGFAVDTWFGLFAPAGTPSETVQRLNQLFVAALQSPDVRQRFAAFMAEPAPTTPAQFADFVKAELAKYEKVVKASGAKID